MNAPIFTPIPPPSARSPHHGDEPDDVRLRARSRKRWRIIAVLTVALLPIGGCGLFFGWLITRLIAEDVGYRSLSHGYSLKRYGGSHVIQHPNGHSYAPHDGWGRIAIIGDAAGAIVGRYQVMGGSDRHHVGWFVLDPVQGQTWEFTSYDEWCSHLRDRGAIQLPPALDDVYSLPLHW